MKFKQPDFTQFQATKYFGSLNALRCISILLVIFYHTAASESAGDHSLGRKGVQLFFVISGFLITSLLLRERDSTGGINLRNFYMRRALRIFPLYFAVLFIHIAVASTLLRHDPDARQFLHFLPFFFTYTVNYAVQAIPHSSTMLFGLAWSLSTEEQFYSIWPWFERSFGARVCTAIIGVSIVALAAVKVADVHSLFASVPAVSVMIRGSSLSICVGVLIAHLLHNPKSFDVLKRMWTPFNSLIALVLFAIFNYQPVPELSAGLLGGILVLSCVQSEEHVLARLFLTRALVAIGTVSYGMYLTHLLCNHTIKIVLKHLPFTGVAGHLLNFGCTAICTYVLSALSYRYFESRFLLRKRKYAVNSVTPTRDDARETVSV